MKKEKVQWGCNFPLGFEDRAGFDRQIRGGGAAYEKKFKIPVYATRG